MYMKSKNKNCSICGLYKSNKTSNIIRHEKSCAKKNTINPKKIECLYCGRIFSNEGGQCAHEKYYCKSNPKKDENIISKNKGKTAWNKGKTKETCEITRNSAIKQSIKMKKMFELGFLTPNLPTKEFLEKLSKEQSLNNRGGKSKWYEVAGQKVQGTYEKRLAEKFETLGIKWYKPKVNKDVWEYVLDGHKKHYTPDFYLEKYDVYLEVKGFWWGNDKEKMKAVIEQNFDKRIFIVMHDELKKIENGELIWI